MTQFNKSVFPATDSAGVQKQLSVTDNKNLETLSKTAESSALNISADTAVKASAGILAKVSVITAGSAPGAVHDIDTTGAAAAANKIGVIPNTVGVYTFDWPCENGITYILGTGQVVSISYL